MIETRSTSRAAMRRVTAAACAITAAAGLAALAPPANAATHRPCDVVKHSSTSGVIKTGTATATVGVDGIKLTTAQSSNTDKVSWQANLNRPVLANTVEEVNYETMKLDETAGDNAVVNDAALPAYTIFVKTPAGPGVLIYEPYYSIGAGNPPRNLRTEWNVLDGPLWTSSTTITGLPQTAGGPATLKFAEVVTANPKMTVTGIGFNLGTYNAGVIAVLDDQRFATKKECSEHQWSTGFKNNSWWPGWHR